MNRRSNDGPDELILLADAEVDPNAPVSEEDRPILVLIVDDDDEVHRTTAFALNTRRILGRRVELLHAFSAPEAVQVLVDHPDTAVAFVDVVMDSEHAGLNLVDTIRNELRMSDVRIILRTGQPGFAPELEAVSRYDINDYYAKTELTQARLVAALTTAVRAYEQLSAVSASRNGLESLARMAPGALGFDSVDSFLLALVRRLHDLVPCATDVALLRLRNGADVDGCRILAGTGRFEPLRNRPVVESLGEDERQALVETIRDHVVHAGPRRRIVPLSPDASSFAYLYVESDRSIRDHEARLLDVLTIAATAALTNVEARERLERLAHVDAPTGLPTRAALERELGSDAHEDDVVVLVEIDRILDVRDAMGPRAGDALLRAAADRLHDHVVGSRLVARTGPAALACLARTTEFSTKQLDAAFARPLEVADLELCVPIRVGIATRVAAEEAHVDPLSAAGLALSVARRSGADATRMFEASMATETRSRLSRVGELRRGIERGELELHYQPQVDLTSGRMLGVESLVRWRKPTGELVPPLTFIDLAEQSGLIVPIGEWVLREACRQWREWSQMGFGSLRIAVNVSVAQFAQPDFARVVATAIRDFSMDPAKLELEITESIGLGDFGRAKTIMEQVRSLGIEWAIDDFGIGYSSLSYLRNLPVARLKIDRAFVSGIRSLNEGVSIPKLIIELAESLGMGVIAEGVETEAVAGVLRELGCYEAQGYLYARPLVSDELVRFAASRNGIGTVGTSVRPSLAARTSALLRTA